MRSCAAIFRSAKERPATAAARLASRASSGADYPGVTFRRRSRLRPLAPAAACAWRRAAGPVSQRPSLGLLVRRPSRLIPHFAITNGFPVTIHLLKASFSRLHSAARHSRRHLDSCRSQLVNPASAVQRIGVCCPDHDTAHACPHNRFRAGRGAAHRGAWLEGNIQRGRTKRSRLAPRRGIRSPRAAARWPDDSRREMTRSPRTRTAPTAGFGLALPIPRRASANAADMKVSSVEFAIVNAKQEGRMAMDSASFHHQPWREYSKLHSGTV